MRLNSGKIAATVILSVLLVLAIAGAALAAPPWTDASDSYWAGFGTTAAKVATVADGYPDGTFKPTNNVTRGQFSKMAVVGLDVPTANPAIASFTDVAKASTFYIYVEGAKAEGLINGTSATKFSPNANITRQQANSILGRYLSQLEIDTRSYIKSGSRTFPSLAAWYDAEGESYLRGYSDWTSIASNHRAATAYLRFREVVMGSAGKLNPTAVLNRAQAAVMVLRTSEVAAEMTEPPPAPTGVEVMATYAPGTPAKTVVLSGANAYVGNDPTPQVKGLAIASSPIAVYDTVGGVTTKLTEGLTSNTAGLFYADLTTALVDGTHSFTAKVKNTSDVLSNPSTPVMYVLDTVVPTGSIAAPVVPDFQVDVAVNTPKPVFTATAADDRSGVKQVEFQVAVDAVTPTWQTVSIDTVASAGVYAAEWPVTGTFSAGLADGQYLFRAVISDNAGNQLTVASTKVTVDTTPPVAQIATGSLTPQPAGGGAIFYSEDRKPQFGALATDTSNGAVGTSASGVAKVDFLYAPYGATPPTLWSSFTLISSDPGTSGFATYPTAGIPDGVYLFAVRATDRAGNESVLGSGNPFVYATGVTRRVTIDNAVPVVAFTAPTVGQIVPDNAAFTITWTLTDTSAPTTVKLEYSDDLGDNWSPITTTAPFTPGSTGSYSWQPPNVAADDTGYKLRITVVDLAGVALAKTAEGQGHYTRVVSPTFTLHNASTD